MSFAELLREAAAALRAHRLRSVLTLLGVIIGVATLSGVLAVITGLNTFVRERVILLSPDVFVVTKMGILRSREEFLDALKRRDIDFREYQRLSSRLRRAERTSVDANTRTAAMHLERRLADVQVHGTSSSYGSMQRMQMASGRFFSEGEDRGAQPLAVIGWDVKDELFPFQDPLGREIRLGNGRYRVIGLLAQQGRTLGQSLDTQVFIPYQAYRSSFGSRGSLDILVQARGGVPGMTAAVDEVRGLLRALRHTSFRSPDPFGVVTAQDLQQLWRQISAAAFILSLLIASVSLGVGGIVIMNIMLVAVVERTREIGVRLALGARKRDVRRQFLLESALLSLGGGLCGVLLGGMASFAIRRGLAFPTEFTAWTVLLGLGLSAAVGITAGYWPARNASNLVVVDALRAE